MATKQTHLMYLVMADDGGELNRFSNWSETLAFAGRIAKGYKYDVDIMEEKTEITVKKIRTIHAN